MNDWFWAWVVHPAILGGDPIEGVDAKSRLLVSIRKFFFKLLASE